MRSLFILAFVFMQFGAMAADVPSNIENSFKSKYPTATDVEWYDEEDGSFVAYFYVNEETKTAKFNTAGSWTETKTFMDESQIPSTVSTAMLNSFKDATVTGATMIELPSALNQFEVSIESEGSTLQLTYDENGNLLKKLEEVIEIDADDIDESASEEDDEE